MLTLYHLAVSHYSEKARWALDFKGLPYRSRLLTPVLHVLHSRWVGGRGTVPVLRDSEARVTLGDSTDVFHYLERVQPQPPLFPDDAERAARVWELEEFFDEHAGRHVSGFLYHQVLDHPSVVRGAWSAGLPWHRRLLVSAMLPLVRPALRRARGINAESARAHRQGAIDALDQLESWLHETGSGYLVGDRFTAADLTAAALLAPAVRPSGSAWDPARRRAPNSPGFPPPDLTAFLREVEAHPAAGWVGEIWERHRGSRLSIDEASGTVG